jgi:hypothetical protein
MSLILAGHMAHDKTAAWRLQTVVFEPPNELAAARDEARGATDH